MAGALAGHAPDNDEEVSMTTSTPPFLPGPNDDDDVVGAEGADAPSSIDADRAAGTGEDVDTDYQPERSSVDADRDAATDS